MKSILRLENSKVIIIYEFQHFTLAEIDKVWMLQSNMAANSDDVANDIIQLNVKQNFTNKPHSFFPFSTDEWHDIGLWTREIRDAETAYKEHSGNSGWHERTASENGKRVQSANGIHGKDKMLQIFRKIFIYFTSEIFISFQIRVIYQFIFLSYTKFIINFTFENNWVHSHGQNIYVLVYSCTLKSLLSNVSFHFIFL